MNNYEFNDFYNMLLSMDEDELDETVLKMLEKLIQEVKKNQEE